MMGGKSLKISQRRSHAAEVLGGDWGRGDSSAFSPAPESTVRERWEVTKGMGRHSLALGLG